ncbi:hypothetical protein ACFQ1R_09325 [Mariniflexile jejuense]|uniref:Uncharacterized protein n=1 Tax=Mariniflexile jejuense TaxID=1173582 RepID=A0ABW3JJM8_9FLAO
MTIKFFSILCICTLMFSCKKNQDAKEQVVEKPNESKTIKAKDIAKLKYTDYILDTRAGDSIASWNEYKQLETIITNIKKGDLSFFIANEKAVNELMTNLKQNIPLEVNSDAILARITALETKVLKLESLSNLSTTKKPELLSVIKEFLVSFSNLNLQMNKKIENDNIIIERPQDTIMPI